MSEGRDTSETPEPADERDAETLRRRSIPLPRSINTRGRPIQVSCLTISSRSPGWRRAIGSWRSGAGLAWRLLPLLERGFRIVCVELGENLASLARHNFEGLPAEVHRAAFEDWDAGPGRFDLVYAATAWAWVDPEVRYRKAHRLLRPADTSRSGAPCTRSRRVSIRSSPRSKPSTTRSGRGCRARALPEPPEAMPDERSDIEDSGLFNDVQVRRYVWEVRDTAEEYIAAGHVLRSHRDARRTRRRLYAEIRRRLSQRPDPRVRRHWYSILQSARAVTAAS